MLRPFTGEFGQTRSATDQPSSGTPRSPAVFFQDREPISEIADET
jgi:hypothetical protein